MKVFMDTEGTPTQELAALLVDDQWRIVDTYHAFAACKTTDDTFSRRHLHGLEIHILYSIGFPNEAALLFDFLRWAASKKVDTFFANDPKNSFLNYTWKMSDFQCGWLEWVSHHTYSHWRRNATSFQSRVLCVERWFMELLKLLCIPILTPLLMLTYWKAFMAFTVLSMTLLWFICMLNTV